jgi:hypothetical protein
MAEEIRKENDRGLKVVKTDYEADFGNPVYIDKNHREYQGLSWNDDKPDLHTVSSDGEPLSPINNYVVLNFNYLFFDDSEFDNIKASLYLDKIDTTIDLLIDYSKMEKYMSPGQLSELLNDKSLANESKLMAFTILNVLNPAKKIMVNNSLLDALFVDKDKKPFLTFKEEGKAFFHSDSKELYMFTKKLDALGFKYDETSQTGSDVVIYDPEKWDSGLRSKTITKSASEALAEREKGKDQGMLR